MNTQTAYFSLDKHKIKFLLLEGIHVNAIKVLSQQGYDNSETRSGSLGEDEL